MKRVTHTRKQTATTVKTLGKLAISVALAWSGMAYAGDLSLSEAITAAKTNDKEYLAAETICDMAASADKTIAFVEGASHKFTPAHACEAFPGQFGDTMAILHDFIAEWLERFTR